MKKIHAILLLFTCLLLGNTKVMAVDATGYIPHKTIVKFQQDFSSTNPPKIFAVSTNTDCTPKKDRTIEKGTVIYLELVKVNKETLGKQNASVVARVVKAYIPSQDRTIDVKAINPNVIVKFSQYEKLDITDKTLDAGISVANRFVKNVTYPAHFVKGAIKNETGNMLKSGVQETFDSSVFSYATAGQPLVLKNGDLATLTYYTKDIADKDIPVESTEVQPQVQAEE